MHSAVLCKDTGKIFYRSEMGDIDETEDEDLDLHKCIEIPHKNDLDLGQSLIFEFIQMHLPDDYDRVRQMSEDPEPMDDSRICWIPRDNWRSGMPSRANERKKYSGVSARIMRQNFPANQSFQRTAKRAASGAR